MEDVQKEIFGNGRGRYICCLGFVISRNFGDIWQLEKRCPPLYDRIEFTNGICPNAEKVQPQIMQFVNNYGSVEEAMPQIEALRKTLEYFS